MRPRAARHRVGAAGVDLQDSTRGVGAAAGPSIPVRILRRLAGRFDEVGGDASSPELDRERLGVILVLDEHQHDSGLPVDDRRHVAGRTRSRRRLSMDASSDPLLRCPWCAWDEVGGAHERGQAVNAAVKGIGRGVERRCVL